MEDVGGVVLVVGVEADDERLMHGDASARKDASAVAPAEWRADQVAAGVLHLRVQVHVLAAATDGREKDASLIPIVGKHRTSRGFCALPTAGATMFLR